MISIDRFEFEDAPFTSLSTAVAVVVGYLSLLAGTSRVMTHFKPYRLESLFILHNALLCAASLVLLLAIVPIVGSNLVQNGLFHSICAREMAYSPRLNFFYYLNYLMKFWELGDTFFLVARKKPLAFLHVYHHAATFLLTWTQLMGKTSVQWVPITINLGIHVAMYYYYAMVAAYPGIKIWWKKHLTTLQIIQFVVDLGFIYYCMYYVVVAKNECQGDVNAGWAGTVLISSYLYLFIEFFYKTYVRTAPKAKHE
ncbi:hypothetical protein HDU91_004916 [Kappamyces sp. JEL0680]|nr:hypothetical protein HDU91_004916 [Kappamyces sp. JEL0680]